MTDTNDRLSLRTYSCLQLAGIYTIEDIAEKSIDDIKKVRNLGMKGYREILSCMEENGYRVEDGRFVKAGCGSDYCEIGGHDEQT